MEDESTSFFSCNFITPEKDEDKSNNKMLNDNDTKETEFTFSCVSNEKSSCFVTPTDRFASGSIKVDDAAKKRQLTELLITELVNNNTGSLDMLKMLLQAKVNNSTAENITNMQTINTINNLQLSKKILDSSFVKNPEPLSLKPSEFEIVKQIQNIVPQSNSTPVKGSGCKCNKSKCLKLYCECFASQKGCGPECGCTDCYNQEQFNDIKQLVVKDILEKNPKAFDNKFKKISKQNIRLHSRGCNCKRSGCQKKYCECYAEGLKCTNMCKCNGCDNCGTQLEKNEINEVQEVIKRKRKRKRPFVNVLIEKLELFKTIEKVSW